MSFEHPLDDAIIHQAITRYFEYLHNHDKEGILKSWHPEGRLFVTSAGLEVQDQEFLTSLPEAIGFEVKDVTVLGYGERLAVAKVDFDMYSGDKKVGIHSGFFALVKEDGEWKIASHIDYGEGIEED